MIVRAAAAAATRRFLDDDAAGPACLSFVGEAGIGKSAVLRAAVTAARADGMVVLSARGSEAETALGFTGLGDLLDGVSPAVLRALPEPQRVALEVATLRAPPGADPVDPRAIGTGLAGVLGELSRNRPAVVAVDDLQWLDAPSARALGFAVRRLAHGRLRLMVTVRSGLARTGPDPTEAVPPDRRHDLTLGPLSVPDVETVAREHGGQDLSRSTLARIAKASRGNPLCAIELTRAISGPDPAIDDVLAVPDRLRSLFRARLSRLPEPTVEALVCLAAVARPRIELVDGDDLVVAERSGLVDVASEGSVTFQHPLLAAAVYADASSAVRRQVHARLAARSGDVEERALHLGLAISGADAAAAEVVADAVRQAGARGALESAAGLAELAARLTPPADAARRAQHLLDAARLHLVAGDPVRAEQVVSRVPAVTTDTRLRIESLRLGSELAGYRSGVEASLALIEEAITLATSVGDLTVRSELRTHRATMLAAAASWEQSHRELGRALADAEAVGDPALVGQLTAFRTGIAAVLGVAADPEILAKALAAEEREHTLPVLMELPILVGLALLWSEDANAACAVLEPLAGSAVIRAAEGPEAVAHAQLALACWVAGRFADADRYAEHAHLVATRAGIDVYAVRAAWLRGLLAAQRGDLTAGLEAAEEALATAQRIGWRLGAHEARGALGMIRVLQDDAPGPDDWWDAVLTEVETAGLYHRNLALAVPDAIEALVLAGDLDRAQRNAEALIAFGERSGYPWQRAVGRRCLAVVLASRGDLDAAVDVLTEALAVHESTNAYETARTLLWLGRLQRRRGERKAARAALTDARNLFANNGFHAWTAQVERELSRVGVRQAAGRLTATESEIAVLAAEGLNNPQIAARLFISRRTVESNLSRAYRKLGITARSELARALRPRSPGEQARTP